MKGTIRIGTRLLAAAALAGATVLAAAQGAGATLLVNCGCTVTSTTAQPVVFASDRTGDMEVYSMNPDGSNLRRLTFTSAYDGQPSWSYDRSKVIFVSKRNSQANGAIYLMNADGTNPVALANNYSTNKMSHPSLSVDGTKYAVEYYFANYNGWGYSKTSVVLGYVSGGMFEAAGLPAGQNFAPRFSPDGKHIAFANRAPGSSVDEVWTMDFNGSNTYNPHRVTYGGGDEPVWSPDSTKIAFNRTASGGAKDIFWTSIGSTSATRVTYTGSAVHPSWSPDGSRILFSTTNVSVSPSSSDLASIATNGGGFAWVSGNTTAFEGDADWGFSSSSSTSTPVAYCC